MDQIIKSIVYADNQDDVINIFGPYDANIKMIEQEFGVNIFRKENAIFITGEDDNRKKAESVLQSAVKLAQGDKQINRQTVSYLMQALSEGDVSEEDMNFGKEYVCVTSRGRKIEAKTAGQQKYIDAIRKNDIAFAIGPAGTGKTFLAVAMAVVALRNKEVSRIVLTRPAVEAGEKLGYLPGDLQHKVDPYLRPLYDSLYEIMGMELFQKNLEKNIIEIAPLAYMRGRTLDDSFIILDEAQNTTIEQMKMFLTRMGFGSKMVITGDVTQLDLPDGKKSGLKEAVKILNDVQGISFSNLSDRDVVRHQLVKKIIKAFERSEASRRTPNR